MSQRYIKQDLSIYDVHTSRQSFGEESIHPSYNSQQYLESPRMSYATNNSESTINQEQKKNDYKEFQIFLGKVRNDFRIINSHPEQWDQYYNKLSTKYKSKLYSIENIESLYVSLTQKKQNKKEKRNWSEDEINLLLHLVRYYCAINGDLDGLNMEFNHWKTLATFLPKRQPEVCKDKWLTLHQMHVHDSPWNDEEDRLLVELIQQHGFKKWTQIAKDLSHMLNTGVYRQAKQCRERWINHLDKSMNKGNWDREEDIKLLTEITRIGRRWSELAKLMMNRTENSVKNRWKSLLKKYRVDLGLNNIYEANTPQTERVVAKKMLNFKLNEDIPLNGMQIESPRQAFFPMMRNEDADSYIVDETEGDFTDEDLDEGVMSQKIYEFHVNPAENSMDKSYRNANLSRISEEEEDKNLENSQDMPSFGFRSQKQDGLRNKHFNGDQDNFIQGLDPGPGHWQPAYNRHLDVDDLFIGNDNKEEQYDKYDNEFEFRIRQFGEIFDDFMQRENESPCPRTTGMEMESPQKGQGFALESSPQGHFHFTDLFMNDN